MRQLGCVGERSPFAPILMLKDTIVRARVALLPPCTHLSLSLAPFSHRPPGEEGGDLLLVCLLLQAAVHVTFVSLLVQQLHQLSLCIQQAALHMSHHLGET